MLREKPIIFAAGRHFVFIASLFTLSGLRVSAGPTFANAVTNGVLQVTGRDDVQRWQVIYKGARLAGDFQIGVVVHPDRRLRMR